MVLHSIIAVPSTYCLEVFPVLKENILQFGSVCHIRKSMLSKTCYAVLEILNKRLDNHGKQVHNTNLFTPFSQYNSVTVKGEQHSLGSLGSFRKTAVFPSVNVLATAVEKCPASAVDIGDANLQPHLRRQQDPYF